MDRPICTRCNKNKAEKHHEGCYRKYCAGCRRKLNKNKFKYKLYKKDKCDFCGFIPIDQCQLDVDHIDGNHKNNNPDNLQTLCANCHRLKTELQRKS